jgi:hypothetical protein
MWRDRFVFMRNIAAEIEEERAASAEPQEYEVSVLYTHWAENDVRGPASTVTLLPPPDDVCLALQEMHWPLAGPTHGKPLRISRETLAALLAPLPAASLTDVRTAKRALSAEDAAARLSFPSYRLFFFSSCPDSFGASTSFLLPALQKLVDGPAKPGHDAMEKARGITTSHLRKAPLVTGRNAGDRRAPNA